MTVKKRSLFILFVFCLVFTQVTCCSAEEMYSISNSELTRLEQNLMELSNINKTRLNELSKLKADLKESQTALTKSKLELTEAQNSLRTAKISLHELEREVRNKPKHALGVGHSNNGYALIAEYNFYDRIGVWVYGDRQSKTVGIKFNF